jgi:hypothetical protein
MANKKKYGRNIDVKQELLYLGERPAIEKLGKSSGIISSSIATLVGAYR